MTEERVRVREVRVLSNDWYVLRKTTFDYRRRDGTWQTLSRETYDRGNGAAILPYDRSRGTVLLTRQFRYLAYVNGHPEPLVEAIAGLLDERSPEEAIRHEAEEAGCRVAQPRRVFEAFMSPGSVTERLVFFVAEYSAGDRVAAGGGRARRGRGHRGAGADARRGAGDGRERRDRRREDDHATPIREAAPAGGLTIPPSQLGCA